MEIPMQEVLLKKKMLFIVALNDFYEILLNKLI